jgi:transcriptional regulator with XRE-family HTH domain
MPFEDDRKESHKAIGLRLQLARAVLTAGRGRVTQAQFALDAGLNAPLYNNYERGISRPQLENALKLVKTYGLSLDYIYLGKFDGLPHGLARDLKDACAAKKAEPAPSPIPSAKVVTIKRRRRTA